MADPAAAAAAAPDEAALATTYGPLLEQCNAAQSVAVRYLGKGKGKGLVATRAIAADETIVVERPLVACQYYWNKQYFGACGLCLKSLETTAAMALRLTNYERLPEGFEVPEAVARQDTPILAHKVGCRSPGCTDEVYCSEACRDAAWALYHE